MMRRQSAVVLLAIIAAVGLLGIPVGPSAPPDVRAATPDLTIVGSARYDVQPTEQRIRVTVDLTLTNRLKDTTTRLFYFDYAVIDVLPRASSIRVSGASGSPRVRITSQT
ncbi:MAG: hypothetical protein ACRDIL_19680, partial [Candidatus Limnocylindrales bacterium]